VYTWYGSIVVSISISSPIYIHMCVKKKIFIKTIHEGHIYIVVLGKDFGLVVNDFFILLFHPNVV
jgi:hypothetical protein